MEIGVNIRKLAKNNNIVPNQKKTTQAMRKYEQKHAIKSQMRELQQYMAHKF